MSKLHAIKSIALAAGIIIVLNLFINFGVRAFYRPPKHGDFCAEEKSRQPYETREQCEAASGVWTVYGTYDAPYPKPAEPRLQENRPTGYCDIFFQCNKEFNSVRDVYNRNVFIILLIAGVIALAIGALLSASAAVSSGLVLGGVLSFIIGTIRYWSGMHDYLRFIILGLALAVLIWIGYRKLQK